MSDSVEPYPHLFAWVIVTEDEGDVDLRSRVCFPRKICITSGSPTSPIDESSTRMAGCAVELAGRLFVLTSPLDLAASLAGDDSRTQRGRALNIEKYLRLGSVVHHDYNEEFTLIEVANNFQGCRVRHTPDCLIHINDSWAPPDPGPGGSELVRLITPDRRMNATLAGLGVAPSHVIDLEHRARNRNLEGSDGYSLHQGHIQQPYHLSQADGGCLVTRHGVGVGIAIYLVTSDSLAIVLLLDDNLRDYLMDQIAASEDEGETHGGGRLTGAWTHLEYRESLRIVPIQVNRCSRQPGVRPIRFADF